MYSYQNSFSKGHPVRLTKKERSKGVPAEITSNEITYTPEHKLLRIVKYKTGIGTGEAKFDVETTKGNELYNKFLKLFERGKTNGKTKKDGLQENCTCGQIGNMC